MRTSSTHRRTRSSSSTADNNINYDISFSDLAFKANRFEITKDPFARRRRTLVRNRRDSSKTLILSSSSYHSRRISDGSNHSRKSCDSMSTTRHSRGLCTYVLRFEDGEESRMHSEIMDYNSTRSTSSRTVPVDDDTTVLAEKCQRFGLVF